MARRRSSKQDSLELLLDTICNTFGGVLFIAILVVLLLQQAGKQTASTTPDHVSLSLVEIQSLTTRLEAVNDELSRLRLNRASQDLVTQIFAPDAVRELLAIRGSLTAQQVALQASVDQLLSANASRAIRVAKLTAENDSIRAESKKSRERLSETQLKLEKDRQSRVHEIRLPVIRKSHKHEIGLVLRYGRLYVWHNYDKNLQRLGLNTDDFVVVSEGLGGLVTHPKTTAGVLLDNTPASQSAVRRVLQRFDPKSCHFAVIARPDSYDVFQHVRDRAIELGFEYRLIPVDANEPIVDRGGTGGQVQ